MKTEWKRSKSTAASIVGIYCFCLLRLTPFLCTEAPLSCEGPRPCGSGGPDPLGPSFSTGPILLGMGPGLAQVAHSRWPVMGSQVSRWCRPSQAVFARTLPVEFSEGALPHWDWGAVACEPWDPGDLPHQRWEMRSWLHPFGPRSDTHPWTSLLFELIPIFAWAHLS